jgi:hypothetical protein
MARPWRSHDELVPPVLPSETETKSQHQTLGSNSWIDTQMIERLWRSFKGECVDLKAFEKGSGARKRIGAWIRYYYEKKSRPIARVAGAS